ncbi:MAG: gfo/Idh/MocA family oxidoreductase, partial [Thermoguttaceae bacterium]|nr:gfo/Idh/MocA family oxidoreductase [Thermoguttaceae bacterium]
GYPLSVEATCPVEVDPMLCPLDVKARYEFKVKDKNGSNRILPLTWYDGKERPPIIAEKGLADLGMGIIFEGTDGILEADYSTIKLYPEEKFAKFQRPKPWIPASPGHYLEWLNAIKNGGPQALCEFEYAGRLSEAVQLGAVSLRAGKKKLIWDAAAAKITNDQQANAFIMRKYRDGWTL